MLTTVYDIFEFRGICTMRDHIDESLNGLLGGKRANFTAAEIDAAKKQQRKKGGTLMDNLIELTGKSMPDMNSVIKNSNDIRAMCDQAGIALDEAVISNQMSLSSEISEMSKNLEEDFGVTADNAREVAAKAHDGIAANKPVPKVSLESFNGLADETAQTVYGQDAFINKLMIAFKRPFVMPPASDMPKNAIYITGGAYTGRHFTLNKLSAALEKRGVLRNGVVRYIDLALYPTAGEEKLFLQDLYSALSSSADIIAFENYQECHASFLANLSDLVVTGKCALNSRYIEQNGQLINVSNALASNAVGELKARGKYLIFISTNPVSKLAGSLGAPFVNALSGDICETAPLAGDSYTKIAEREKNTLTDKAAKQLKFRLETDDSFITFAVSKADRNAGLKGILDFFADAFTSLAQLRLEREYNNDEPVRLVTSSKDGAPGLYAVIRDEEIELSGLLPRGYTGEIESIKAEMDKIVGLTKIKEYVFSLEEYYRVQQRRREEGLKAGEVSKHMIFTGSPGTGKTTIARIISKYLKAIGVLSGGQLVEVSRADLVGRYVGHTAPLTNQVISSAIGGVLFIDEAYSLYRGRDDSFGLEAIDTLVKGIEDNRENLIVILAGYSKEMQEFLTSNSGLKSRFPNVIDFPDYTGEELLAIAKINAGSRGYKIDEGADPALLSYFNAVQALRACDAGNGRLARNKIEEAILNQSRRLVAEPDADLSLLTSQDFDLNDIDG